MYVSIYVHVCIYVYECVHLGKYITLTLFIYKVLKSPLWGISGAVHELLQVV